jgi:hypothetical protein
MRLHSSASHAKSEERIDGEMTVVGRSRPAVTAGKAARGILQSSVQHDAQCAAIQLQAGAGASRAAYGICGADGT